MSEEQLGCFGTFQASDPWCDSCPFTSDCIRKTASDNVDYEDGPALADDIKREDCYLAPDGTCHGRCWLCEESS